MLTDTEVKRLEEVEEEYQSMGREQASLRNSEAYKKRFRKGLSSEEKQEVNLAKEREEDLSKKIDSLVEERNALTKKRDGNWKPDESSKKWYPEPGYGPSW